MTRDHLDTSNRLAKEISFVQAGTKPFNTSHIEIGPPFWGGLTPIWVRPSQMESIQTCNFPEKPPCHQNISQDNSLLTSLLLNITSCKRKCKTVRSSKVMERSDLTLGLHVVCTSFLLSHETPHCFQHNYSLLPVSCHQTLCSFLSVSIGSTGCECSSRGQPCLGTWGTGDKGRKHRTQEKCFTNGFVLIPMLKMLMYIPLHAFQ